ncbi:MAG TPA: erythromycin esterase family protein [Thermoanaerobaculia bacterium]|nr:erythromycin esterase family protein [Thermoanaerobaculia bacterium]
MKTVRLRPLVLLLLALAAPAGAQEPELEPGAEAARRPRPVGNPVMPGVWRLEGNDPSLPHADLEPLRQVIGKATVVGLGETIHTSGGYYRMKHRVFRFLVERMGFRVFAFESPWENAEEVARFVATCEGSARNSLRGLFGVWASEETRELVQWMCDWNRTHRKPKDKLHFFGFDIQQPEDDGPALIAFLQRIGLPGDDPRIAGIRKCDGVEVDHFPAGRIPEADHQQCIQALDGVGELFARESQSIIRQTSRADLEWAKIRQVGLRAWEFEIWFEDGRSYSARDEGMAYAFHAIRGLRFPKAKVAVWAHNSHISKAPRPGDNGIPMGMHLASALGKSYVNLGLAAHDVAIDWRGLGCGPVDLLGNSIEQILHDLGQGDLLVDLDVAGGRPPLPLPDTFIRLGNRLMVPRDHFDGLLYLEVSPAMVPLNWPRCR